MRISPGLRASCVAILSLICAVRDADGRVLAELEPFSPGALTYDVRPRREAGLKRP
jgi:hypothetical protein